MPSFPSTPAVLISGGQLAAGGVQTHLEYLITLLLGRGVSVTVAASGCQWGRPAVDKLAAQGCRFLMPPFPLWRWRRVSLLWSVAAWTLRLWKRPFTSAYFIGGGHSHFFLRRLLGGRTPSIYHEIVETPAPGSAEDRLTATSTAIVANSRKVAAGIRAAHASARIEVIPFLTTDGERSMPLAAATPPGAEGSLRLVYLGRLVGHKRPDQLVYQWRQLTAMLPIGPATLDIHGYDLSGEMMGPLQEYVRRESLEQQITIHGPYNFTDVENCLSNKHVLVLPSLFEGLPLVLVEAMQRGIPIVACDSGGTAELADGNPDVVVTSTDWNDFAEGLQEMARRVRDESINPRRLQSWTSSRYGYEVVSQKWLEALLAPRTFFSLETP